MNHKNIASVHDQVERSVAFNFRDNIQIIAGLRQRTSELFCPYIYDTRHTTDRIIQHFNYLLSEQCRVAAAALEWMCQRQNCHGLVHYFVHERRRTRKLNTTRDYLSAHKERAKKCQEVDVLEAPSFSPALGSRHSSKRYEVIIWLKDLPNPIITLQHTSSRAPNG